MNVKEYEEATFGFHEFEGDRLRKFRFRFIETEDALKLAMFPLVFFPTENEIPPSPEEEEVMYLNLLDEAKRVICRQSAGPKFVMGEVRDPKNELPVDELLWRCKEDPQYGKGVLNFYKDILNQSGIKNQERKSSDEEVCQEVLVLACSEFKVDPTEARRWPAWRSSQLAMDYKTVVDARIKAEEEARREAEGK